MTSSPIGIVGAGIGGLTLARCLRKRGVPSVIYEKSSRPGRHTYGITLDATTCKALTENTDVTSDQLRHDLAILPPAAHGSTVQTDGTVRAFRYRLEDHMSRELSVKYGMKVSKIAAAKGEQPHLTFEDGTSVSHEIVVDASGVHSTIRTVLLPSVKPQVLPFAAYSGRRTIKASTFKTLYADAFDTRHSISVRPDPTQHTRMEVSLSGPIQEGSDVDVRYGYSRPARSDAADPLARPGRMNEDATAIPHELYDEVKELADSKPLEAVWRDVFDTEQMRHDRILHWLMRSVLVSKSDWKRLAEMGVVLLGDSAHATAILGGRGANVGMQDSCVLAGLLAESRSEAASKFVDARYSVWEEESVSAEEAIRQMHWLLAQ